MPLNFVLMNQSHFVLIFSSDSDLQGYLNGFRCAYVFYYRSLQVERHFYQMQQLFHHSYEIKQRL